MTQAEKRIEAVAWKIKEIAKQHFAREYQTEIGYCHAIRAALSDPLLLSAVRAEGWIPVGERLPKEYECVLVYRVGMPDFVGPIIAFHNADGWFVDVMRDPLTVTHWMPLPAPPSLGDKE